MNKRVKQKKEVIPFDATVLSAPFFVFRLLMQARLPFKEDPQKNKRAKEERPRDND